MASSWLEEIDRQHPTAGKEYARYKAVNQYLEEMGFIISERPMVLFLLLFQNLFIEPAFNGFFGPGLQFFKFCVRECGGVSVLGKSDFPFVHCLTPKQETLLKIAKALGVHLRDLSDDSWLEEFEQQHPDANERANRGCFSLWWCLYTPFPLTPLYGPSVGL